MSELISVDNITSSPFQYRRVFDEASLRELAKSIEQDGLIQQIKQESIEDCILKALQSDSLSLKELIKQCQSKSIVVSNAVRKLVANNKVGIYSVNRAGRRKNIYYLINHQQKDEIIQQQKIINQDNDAWWDYISERYKHTRSKFPDHEIKDSIS